MGGAAFLPGNSMGASPSDDSTQASHPMSARMNAARRSIVVKAPVECAYAQWARVEELPKFITLLRDVRRIDNTKFSYTWGPNGDERRGVLQIVLQIPARRIAWCALSSELMSGVVSFEPRSEAETEVTLKIRSTFDVRNLSHRLKEYLGNFKRLVESEDATR
jgi:uncharacterized membrane protein